MSTDFNHLSAERLQAFLDGDLPAGDVARVEEHLAACVRCSEELASWSVLFEDLDGLPSLAPPAGFAERVIAGIQPAAPTVTVPHHVPDELLQEYLDGVQAIPGLREAVRLLGPVESPAFIATASEFIFEGLHLHEKLNRDRDGGRWSYRA